jgi:hypothetical protein
MKLICCMVTQLIWLIICHHQQVPTVYLPTKYWIFFTIEQLRLLSIDSQFMWPPHAIANIFASTQSGQPVLHPPCTGKSLQVFSFLCISFLHPRMVHPRSSSRLILSVCLLEQPWGEWVTRRQSLMDLSPRSARGMWVRVNHPFSTSVRRM